MINNYKTKDRGFSAIQWKGHNELEIREFCGHMTDKNFGEVLEIKSATPIECPLFSYVCQNKDRIWVEA